MAPAAGTADLVDTFRHPEFNVAAFVRDATSQGSESAAKLSQRLEDCASEVDEELRREIAACHEELLQNAGKVDDLDGELGSVREVVDALKNSVSRVRSDVLSPFQCVKRRAQLLARMQAVNVLIRKLLRFLFDARKLRTQMEAPTKDYSKAAHTLNELESVLQESSLERVDVLRSEVAWIRETGARIRKQAEDDLRGGVRQGNQIALSISLQVFFNLKCLWPQLQRVLSELVDEFAQMPLSAGASLQQSLDVNLQVLVAHVQRIYMLDEIIRSKTDALTHSSFSAALEREGVSSLTAHFWAEATKRFTFKFARISQDRAARKGILAEFPKILHALTEAMDRVSMVRGRVQVLKAADRDALYASVANFRNEFLAESIRRVTEPVEMMLPDKLLATLTAAGEHVGSGLERVTGSAGDGGSLNDELPTSHDLRRYVQLLVAELERNEICPDLLLKEAVRNVRSSVLLFATRLEQVIDSSSVELRCFESESASGEAALRLRTPLPMPAAGHARNARLFGIAHHTLLVLKETIPSRFQPAIVTQQVQNTLQQTQAVIIAPMTSSLQRAAHTAIGASIANITSSGDRGADGSEALLALNQACAHIGRYYFSLFGSGQLLQYLKELCVFFIRVFLAAAVLVKPMTEANAATLAQDMQALETALAALDAEFQAHVRYEAAVFGEFRKLLFSPPLGLAELEELANVIPLPLLLIYAVNQLPSEVPTLPAFSSVSEASYADSTMLPLLDGDPEVLDLLKGQISKLLSQFGLNSGSSSNLPAVAFLTARVR
mmetsp:Transcript_38054/g.69592  ORF Transcript_38054/g.69592 Transcript_38054/m.69592 type:complete len:781 (+) Transcript_38054:56-2398(+)